MTVIRATKVGISVACQECFLTKKPRGRSAPLGAVYCDDECSGYSLDPKPGDLWPGETDAEFGYPCSDYATEPVEAQATWGGYPLTWGDEG